MEKLYNFTDNDTISKEASAWMVKLDGDDPLSEQELADFREWLDRSPAHREKLGRMVDMWGGMNVLTKLSVPLGKLEHHRDSGNASNSFWRQYQYAFLSAAAIVISLAIVLGYRAMPDQVTRTNGQYVTAIGQQQQTNLSDGSSIQLNTNSQIRVDYNEYSRDIYLQQGEAYFEVAKNKNRPFRVFVGNERVQAVGTAFTVRLKDSDLNVIVTEGRVTLATLSVVDTETIPQKSNAQYAEPDQDYVQNLGTLDAGQSATIKRSQASSNNLATIDSIEKINPEELMRRLAWRKGRLNFAGEPLEQVVEEISRYTTNVIQIDDPAVRAIKIGGQFEVGDINMLLDTLEASFSLRIVHSGPNQVLIFPPDE